MTTTTGDPAAIGRRRVAVRKKALDVLTATPVANPGEVVLSGTTVPVYPGQWIITRGAVAIEILSDKAFQQAYEVASDKGLLIRGPIRAQIERALGFGSTDTPEHLATAINRLVDFKIGTVEVTFSPAEQEQLVHRAKKRGLSVAAYTQQVVDKLVADLFTV